MCVLTFSNQHGFNFVLLFGLVLSAAGVSCCTSAINQTMQALVMSSFIGVSLSSLFDGNSLSFLLSLYIIIN